MAVLSATHSKTLASRNGNPRPRLENHTLVCNHTARHANPSLPAFSSLSSQSTLGDILSDKPDQHQRKSLCLNRAEIERPKTEFYIPKFHVVSPVGHGANMATCMSPTRNQIP